MQPSYTPNAFAFDLLALFSDVPWVHVTEARKECLMSASPMTYTYGQGRGVRTYTSTPLTPVVEAIQAKLNADGFAYNVCFLNRYDDQHQRLGWHADDSPGMLHEHPIAVVSFGAERDIWWKRRDIEGPVVLRQRLSAGSLFVMPPGFQREYQHRIPKSDRPCGIRISLTFRRYIA